MSADKNRDPLPTVSRAAEDPPIPPETDPKPAGLITQGEGTEEGGQRPPSATPPEIPPAG